jgi:hypothetical protein
MRETCAVGAGILALQQLRSLEGEDAYPTVLAIRAVGTIKVC